MPFALSQLQTKIVPEVHEALTNLEPLLGTSRDTLSVLQTQILPEARETLIDLDNLSTSFTGIATKINRDPSIVIRGTTPMPLGPGESK